ncbi:hypothetical protein F938_04324 [Acinetobacter bereziniae LMG 1003 = CIP 70.12]|uniref:Uncharacterized protein n=1 Tax=Acinetobacter bereziniae LMG 1003 = CIP 70.12 TaxID=981324 RepID=N9E9H8_ACIBZ|nr:hypothetical protein F938_04324 [Acinetobacter bereziniae LMG 1003 = CIP 70.12]
MLKEIFILTLEENIKALTHEWITLALLLINHCYSIDVMIDPIRFIVKS